MLFDLKDPRDRSTTDLYHPKDSDKYCPPPSEDTGVTSPVAAAQKEKSKAGAFLKQTNVTFKSAASEASTAASSDEALRSKCLRNFKIRMEEKNSQRTRLSSTPSETDSSRTRVTDKLTLGLEKGDLSKIEVGRDMLLEHQKLGLEVDILALQVKKQRLENAREEAKAQGEVVKAEWCFRYFAMKLEHLCEVRKLFQESGQHDVAQVIGASMTAIAEQKLLGELSDGAGY